MRKTPKLRFIESKMRQKGIKIKPDVRLHGTPFRAMNPEAGRELKQPFIKGCYTYDPHYYDFRNNKDKDTLAMDINHEDLEDRKIKKLKRQGIKKRYPIAHKFANKHQRQF